MSMVALILEDVKLRRTLSEYDIGKGPGNWVLGSRIAYIYLL